MELTFNADVMIPKFYDSFNQDIMEITILTGYTGAIGGSTSSYRKNLRQLNVAGYYTRGSVVDFNWTIESYGARKVRLALDFDQPLDISREVSQLHIQLFHSPHIQ